MKSILYVGATLMIGACIYGFVDYKKTSSRKEFINMYKAKEQPVLPVTIVKTNEVTTKKETVAAEKPVTDTTTAVVKKISVAGKKYIPVKRKKLSYKLFSRAALDEKVESRESPEVRKN
jgi:hypothetical protein